MLRTISPLPVFSIRLENFLPFLPYLKMSSANSLILEESKKFVVWERVKTLHCLAKDYSLSCRMHSWDRYILSKC